MKKPDAKLIAVYLLVAGFVIGLAAMCSSCRTVKEVTRTETVYDSTAITEKDSIINVKQVLIERLLNEIKENQYSGVVFDTMYLPGDTVINTITIKADGSIEAAGRIRSANVSKEKIQRQYTELQHSYDSLYRVKQKTIVDVQWKEKIVEKKVKRGWQWWLFVLGCVFWHFTGKKILSFFKK